MNLEQLRASLATLELDAQGYRVLEPPDDSTWCLQKQGKTWLVFWFERGTSAICSASNPKPLPASTS